MSLLDKLERRFGRFGLPHVTIALIACQVVVYCISYGLDRPGDEQESVVDRLLLVPQLVLAGEAWRLVAANPADAAGLGDRGQIAVGRRADLVAVEDGAAIPPRCIRLWRGGRRVER